MRHPLTARLTAGALALAVALGCMTSRPPAGEADATRAAPASPPEAAASPARRSVTYLVPTMGTYARIVLVTADSAASAQDAIAARAALLRVDSLMSNWTTTSEVARLNREADRGPTVVQAEVSRVLDASLRAWRESDGAFDITVEPLVRAWGFIGGPRRVPTAAEAAEAFRHVGAAKLEFDPVARTLRFKEKGVRVDLGGIAKGYAVDVAAESLAAHGVRDALVDLSGNMFAIGHPPDADHWRIGIRDPRDRMPFFARVPLYPGQAISTSGKYEQFVSADGKTYGHILDPRTGRPSEGLISVTVLSRSALDSDTWDTPLFVLGLDEAKRKARERDNIDVVLVVPGAGGVDTVWVERTLQDRFALEDDARPRFRVAFF
jgi:thiamine biosynthesis lipoprotein